MVDMETRHQVYFANRTALVAYATRIVGSRETAEDIVQEAFLRFAPASANSASSERSTGLSLAYLYRIVRNLSLDLIKRRKIEAREEQSEPPYWSMPIEVPSPEDIVVVTDEIRRVTGILADLPTEIRVALEMHRFGGYTLEEIAVHLDISVATAHRHVRTAMMRVATVLASDAS
ncbi:MULTISPECIES: sigma-70 family RNA polymerase sigma factor [unclassified Ensifer]|uniref:RNA polymerase sigma factor n=1 Tax=unclassified Ensifer TaxID=2633371 RepID=UPI000812D0EA|nr:MULTISPECIES: sigma-70 family RNA polymerase sigma factor [unclassified Ensifer]OCP00459.1 RNA polymerase subunit sigma-70 [Ensifer sp. LC14]OCP05833.1 RNA polymerase subunit sigma-70 [Ensifer sp. LC11]OCP06578.1 RNA polymerase subunit sigma-70 [Ensifer sp. LC13]OCP31182.1 RNA polymerase subunit sigma-70 [Ensifer sp. LC499]